MTARATLYTRAECCLCDEMKAVVRQVAGEIPLAVEEIDVDSTPELQVKYGYDVPVLLINGQEAFKHRTTIPELRAWLQSLQERPES